MEDSIPNRHSQSALDCRNTQRRFSNDTYSSSHSIKHYGFSHASIVLFLFLVLGVIYLIY